MMNNRELTLQFTGEVNRLLGTTSVCLAEFLLKTLPTLCDDWWEKTVIRKLSVPQVRRVEQQRITSLEGLDLAGLLRVLDQNWHPISDSLDLPFEARHYLKEMQTVRNRWAHPDTNGFPQDDIYRDLDTLQRFAQVIEADPGLIQDVKAVKTKLRSAGDTAQQVEAVHADLPPPAAKQETSDFVPGQIVVLISDSSQRGAVLSVEPGKPENRVNVFMNGSIQMFYASQVRAEESVSPASRTVPCDQFHATLTALQIRYPGLSTLYSLNAARVDFIPYQFRPVLRFIRSDRPRLLIADTMGVGKTIEAGLILRELQARREIRSVLIICPRQLIVEKKWQREMKRFEEQFTHLDGAGLRYCIQEMDLDGVWPEQQRKVIVPYSLFDEALLYGSAPGGKGKRKIGLLDLDPPPRFDLVIVDEAHHVRNPDTFSHKAVRFFCDHAEAVVFLTATPVQLGSQDLFVLLNMLRPDLVIDPESFRHMAEPNPFINQAVAAMRSQLPGWQEKALQALEEASSTPWGRAILKNSPTVASVSSKLLHPSAAPEDRVQMISETEEMHTFARIINRTRRRDIGNFTVRKPETVTVPFTPGQQHLHDELLRIQADIFSRIHGEVNVKFMMTTIRRQAASCLFGLAPFLEDILKRHLDELAWEEADDAGTPTDAAISAIKDQIQSLLEAAKTLEPYDPKFEALRKIVCNKQSLANNKIMLFSSFRHTLNYLYDQLVNEGCRVGLVHGGTPDEDRMELRNRFEMQKESPDCIDLLLFSEIGCEGLDYQFCDCIVNYDLPWNPMRVDQRIGRIDRNGQKSESVAIINLVTPGTVDADIYERCLMRIGVFHNAIGDCEEILGEVTREIKNIAESYELTDHERGQQLQQLADNQIRLIQEQEALEQKQSELFGIRLPKDQMRREIDDASSFWLSPEALRRMVTLYLQRVCGKEQEMILGEKSIKNLRLAQEYRDTLLKDFQQLPRQNTTMYRDWETWLKGSSPHLPITFESESAMQHPEAAFIMPLHPLVKQAALDFETKDRVMSRLQVESEDVPEGQYEFAVYQWRFFGIREDLILQPVASSATLTGHLTRLLEEASDIPPEEPMKELDASVWKNLDEQHYALWKEAKEKHTSKTKELAAYQRESLNTSHRARITLLQEQFANAKDDKIRKMRESQISAAEADYGRRIQELEIAIEKADLVAGPIAYGQLNVIRKATQ